MLQDTPNPESQMLAELKTLVESGNGGDPRAVELFNQLERDYPGAAEQAGLRACKVPGCPYRHR